MKDNIGADTDGLMDTYKVCTTR